MKDLNKKRLFYITEVSKKKTETYGLYMSENEIKKYIKTKNEVYGYVEGLGGDRSYSCWAVYANY